MRSHTNYERGAKKLCNAIFKCTMYELRISNQPKTKTHSHRQGLFVLLNLQTFIGTRSSISRRTERFTRRTHEEVVISNSINGPKTDHQYRNRTEGVCQIVRGMVCVCVCVRHESIWPSGSETKSIHRLTGKRNGFRFYSRPFFFHFDRFSCARSLRNFCSLPAAQFNWTPEAPFFLQKLNGTMILKLNS